MAALEPKSRRTAKLDERPDPMSALISAPLPAVQVQADGKPVAISDNNGDVQLSLDARPSVLTLMCKGWQLARLERMHGGMRYVAWMKRH